MFKILAEKLRAFESGDARLVWGIPLAIASTLGLLLLANLLIVGKEDPNASLVEAQSPVEASADAAVALAGDEASSDAIDDITTDSGVRILRSKIKPKRVVAAEPLPGEDQVLPERPEAELIAARLFEVSSGHWQLQQRPYVYTELSKPRVVAVMRQRKTFLPLASVEPGHFSYRIENETRLIVSQEEGRGENGQISFDRSRKFRYALQLVSLPAKEIAKAWPLAEALVNQGYYVYWSRSDEPRPTKEGDQFLYKLRVGFYESEYETVQLANEIQGAFPEEPLIQHQLWPVLPEFDEVDLEVMDFGVQRSRPYCLDLASYRSLGEGLSEMAQVGGYFDVLYLSQKKDANGYLYQLEAGFYLSQAEAQKALDLARRKSSLGLSGARIANRRYKISADRGR
ncbi:MAG: hypothetical protein RRB13_07630 [bacterium]|nr:hypothetical protein [bacterium]